VPDGGSILCEWTHSSSFTSVNHVLVCQQETGWVFKKDGEQWLIFELVLYRLRN